MSHLHVQELIAIRDEFLASRAALRNTIAVWPNLEPTVDIAGTKLKDFRHAESQLEKTYTVRLFSQFEAVLRDYLRAQGRRVPRFAEILINRAAAMVGIDADMLNRVHQVRNYRNALVHEDATPVAHVDFMTALTSLNIFVSRLP